MIGTLIPTMSKSEIAKELEHIDKILSPRQEATRARWLRAYNLHLVGLTYKEIGKCIGKNPLVKGTKAQIGPACVGIYVWHGRRIALGVPPYLREGETKKDWDLFVKNHPT